MVTLDAFWIDKTEVTNVQYMKCVAAKDCDPPAETSSFGRISYYGDASYANYPVINVSWQDASDYCSWAGRHLPTEAQWEKAARGEMLRAYPWGEKEPSCELANGVVDGKMCIGDTTEVGSYPDGASPYGILDMAGNVWEWVQDWYDGDYYSSLEEYLNPLGPNTGTYRVLRGGGFGYYYNLLTSYRGNYNPDSRYYGFGFRCAASSAP